MSNKMTDVNPCRLQPQNIGLNCNEYDDAKCKKCGWNPTVDKIRKTKRQETIKEQEK